MKIKEIFVFIIITFAIVSISTAYPTISDGEWCDVTNLCRQEMLCISNKCLDIRAIAARYGPVNISTDGAWCDSSSSCTENMFCLNNECIDINRNWGSTNGDDQNASDNEIQYYQRIRPFNIDLNSPPIINSTVKPHPVEHGSVQHQ